MALQKINRNLLDTGVSDSSDATAITIDSSERVGIGMAPNSGSLNYAMDIQATTAGNALRIKGRSAGGNEGWLVWTDNSNNPEAGIYATSDNLIFANTTSYTETMRIDGSGRVMIGTTTEGRANEGADMFTIGDDGSNNSGMTMRSGTSGYGSIYFSDATSGTGEYAGYVQYAHNTNRMLLATDSTTRLLIDSDGLKFGSDTAAANALDDYEEGTWTPTVNDGTISGAGGHYTKIGRVVTVSYYYNLTTLGSSSGVVQIGGLPFAAKTAGGDGHQTVGSILCRYFSKNQIVSYLGDNLSYLTYYNNGTGNFDSITFGEIEVSYDNDFAAHGTHTYITS